MIYDSVIIGAGAAGITAGIYLKRWGRSCIVLEKQIPGGQINITPIIENYPGYIGGGAEFSEVLKNQAQSIGLSIESSEAVDIENANESVKSVVAGKLYRTRTIILAGGAKCRRLGVNGEKRLTGFGVSYCATCDGIFFKDKTVIVVGGGNTAVEEALYLSDICAKVYIIHRREEFRADKTAVEIMLSRKNISIIKNSVIDKIDGKSKVEGAVLKNKNGNKTKITADGIFIAIGRDPDTAFIKKCISLDDAGYILTNAHMQTNIPGIYAAGDIRTTPLRQLITAAADGAIAAKTADEYISKMKS